MKRSLVISLLGATVASSAFASVMSDAPTVLELRNARIDMPTLATADASAAIAATAQRADGRHVVVRLHRELDPAGRDAIARDGIRLLTCLGARTWIAAVAPDAAGDALVDRVAWVGDLPANAKLHPWLAAGNVPDWTIDRREFDAFVEGRAADVDQVLEQALDVADPVVALYVVAHRDVSLDDFTAALTLAGGEVRSRMNTVNGLLVRIRMSAIDALVGLDETVWVEPALPPLSTNNASNRVNTQVDQVRESPYGLDGTGVTVMVYDGGYADASHPDFGGRLTVRDSSGQSTHGTHVCGTVGGDGTNSGGQHEGMAPAVTIQSYGFEQEGGLSEGFLYTDPGDIEQDYSDAINNWGAVVANNSIGTNTAPNGFPCEWTGDYGVTSGVIDSVVRGALGGDIRICWANGNERQTTRCGDLYNTTAPPACAKNHITVGATNSNDDSITSFTSWGPADDGRIKPDISAPGCQSNDDNGVTSTFPGGGYGTYCGTSMATPTVTGISALIIQDWRQQYPDEADLSNAALKALLANSGDDLGNPGPDCQYGFGTVRTKQAIDSLRAGGVLQSEVGDGGTGEHLVIVQPGDDLLRITLAWDDEPASPLPVFALVNDLDLVVTDPAGNRVFPWTIDPANPGAPATRSGEDRINNMEQVSVESPMPGAWRVQIVGHSVPVGPQEYALVASPNPIACSSTGIAGFGGAAFQPGSTVAITVVDCDLNTDDTITDSVTVHVSSDSNPGGFDITLLEEDPAASTFSGSVQLVSSGGGGLLAVDGDEITLEYLDEMDASGGTNILVTDTARVDGSINAPTSVAAVDFGPDSATIQIVTDEPVRVTVHYGLSCDNLSQSVSRTSFGTDQTVTISGLEDTFTYFYRIELTDQAGNTSTYGNGVDCFEFTVPDALDFYAEQFGSFDLENTRITFFPISGADRYAPCAEPIASLPFSSAGSTAPLSDDSSHTVSLPFTFNFYDGSFSTAYIGSNGYVTFEGPDTGYSESWGEHFEQHRISGLFDDLNPSAGGTVTYGQQGDAFVVTWNGVAEYGTSNSNTFQIAWRENGEIVMAWLGIDVGDAIVGLSPGGGVASNFVPNDLSSGAGGCVPRPPSVFDINVATSPGTGVDITLLGNDDGEPLPMVYVIDTLPLFTLRDLSTGLAITSVPHVIAATDGPHLRYEPAGSWEGVASFVYHADDGGTPPEGGPSEDATVTISVASGPQVVASWNMDTNPGWSLEGGWAFGSPTGGSGDPNGGFSGSNVIGYVINGDYPNNMPETHATTPSVDCSLSSGTILRFKRWLGVESATYDHAYVRVSGDGGSSWTTIWSHTGGSFEETSWSSHEFDISAIADGQSDVRIRFTMGATDGSVTYCGWNLDEVEVIGVIPNNGVEGDLNGDGIVNGADMGLLLSSWGACAGCPADLNGDGVVNGADMGLLLANWTSGGAGREALVDGRDASDVDDLEIALLDRRLINDGLLVPTDGLMHLPGGYLQTTNGVLSLEIAGSNPIVDHDLVVIEGAATLDGVLDLVMPDARRLPSGLAVVLVADEIVGDFAQVVSTSGRADLTVCTTTHAIVVRFGDGPVATAIGESALPAEVLGLLDAIGTDDPAWDLDGDGVVGESDLGILLRSGIDCR